MFKIIIAIVVTILVIIEVYAIVKDIRKWSKRIKSSKPNFVESDLTIEVNGKTFPLEREVFDLIKSTSMERDIYREIFQAQRN